MESKLIRGLPVIALDNGKLLGKVQELAVDAMEKKVAAIIIGEKIFLRTRSQVIPYGRVHSFGSDAVTIANAEEIQDLPSRPDIEEMLEYNLLEHDLISEKGDRVGKIIDFTLDPISGTVHGLILKEGMVEELESEQAYIPIDAVMHFGKDFVISKSNAVEQLEPREESEPKSMPKKDGPAKKRMDMMARDLTRSLEVRAIDFALNREAGHTVIGADGHVIVQKGEKVTQEIIDQARAENRLYQVLFAAGVGELLDGIDYTLDKLDAGSRRLVEAWHSFQKYRGRETPPGNGNGEMETEAKKPDLEEYLADLSKTVHTLQERLDRLEKSGH